MDTKIFEIEILLEKLNLLFASVKKDGQIDKFESELLKKYVQQLHDAVHEKTVVVPVAEPEKKVMPPVVEEVKPVVKEIVPEKKVEMPPVKEEIPPVVKQEEIITEKKELPIKEEAKKEIIPPVMKEPEIKKTQEPEKKQVKKPLVSNSENEEEEESYNSGLHTKLNLDKKTLAEKITTHKARDLKSVIHLNDKLFFVKELFRGDAQAYDREVNAINAISNFGDVKKYIQHDLVPRYNWTDLSDIERLLEVVKLKFE